MQPCCCGKALSITHSECVFIAVLIQHAKCVCCIILLSVAYSDCTTFFHIISIFWENVIDCNET